MTVGEYAEQWLSTHERPKKSTRDSYEGTVRWLHGQEIATIPLTSVGRSYARSLAQRFPSRIGCLSSMFTDATREGLVPDNPFHNQGLKRKPGRKNIVPMNAQEIDLLKANAGLCPGLSKQEHHVWEALITVLAFTGIRPSEAFALKWRDIDMDNKELHIKRAYVNGVIGNPKNGNVRTIVLPELAAEELRRLGDFNRENEIESEWVFPTKTGKPYTKSLAWPVWDKIRRRHSDQMDIQDIGRHQELIEARGKDLLDLYELRHFCATYLLDKGVRPEDVAYQLGHTDGGALVISTYGHPDEDKIRDRIRQGFDTAND